MGQGFINVLSNVAGRMSDAISGCCTHRHILVEPLTRGGARGGLRGLKPRMFSVKPLMFLLPCLVSTITEFS